MSARTRRVRTKKRHTGYTRILAEEGFERCSCHGDLFEWVGREGKNRIMECLDDQSVIRCGGMR